MGKKNRKYIAVLLISILAFTAGAAILEYYAGINANINVGNILNIDGYPAENLIITKGINIYPSQTNTTNYTFMSNIDTNISFAVESPYIDVEILYNNTAITYLDMTKNVSYALEIVYTCPFNVTSGVYWSNITINPNGA